MAEQGKQKKGDKVQTTPPPQQGQLPHREDAAAKAGKIDPFWIEKVFPSADALLTTRYPATDDILKNCIYVLDANTLLAPFLVGQESVKEVGAVFRKLVKEDRLFVPAQAVREYAKHRATKVAEAFLRLQQEVSKLAGVPAIHLPMFENISEFKAVAQSTEKLREAIKDHKAKLASLVQRVRQWNYDDPISRLYAEVFSGKNVVNHSMAPEQIQTDVVRRFTHGIPPGYKDQSKQDGGIGDVLIWQTILQLGKDRERNVVFVSNDAKSDWMVRHGEESLFPRFELVEEFHRHTGKHFAILRFNQFLQKMGADKAAVEEVESLAAERRSSEVPSATGITLGSSVKEIVQHIESILLEFVAEDHEGEYKYIQHPSFENCGNYARVLASKASMFTDDRSADQAKLLMKIAMQLNRMVELNAEIRHQAYRYKRSMQAEQEQLEQLALIVLDYISMLPDNY